MIELAHRPRLSEQRDHPLPDAVRASLIESERRVIVHCRSLLERGDLSPEDRRRLARVASEAERKLQQLPA